MKLREGERRGKEDIEQTKSRYKALQESPQPASQHQGVGGARLIAGLVIQYRGARGAN